MAAITEEEGAARQSNLQRHTSTNRLVEAMKKKRKWDEEQADHAITMLARTESAHRIVGGLWRYGARDYRNIGHKAIFVANAWRTLQTIGWRHAEPVLRSLVLGLLDFGRWTEVNDYTFANQCFKANTELARENHERLPGNWTTATGDAAATESLLDSMRSGDSAEACRQAVAMLSGQSAGAPEVWDAVHLAAGELMMQQPGIYGIHTVTSAHALRYAFETAAFKQARLMILLQGIGWMCQFRNFMSGNQRGLQEIKITEMVAAAKQSTTEEIFDLVGKDTPTAASKAMSLGLPGEFKRTANQLLLRKATDAHDFKYATSIFDDYNRVSPRWQPHMLATATYYLRGTNSPDSEVMHQAAEVISSLL